MRGTVKWFNEEKGYGFIEQAEGGEDAFVCHEEIIGDDDSCRFFGNRCLNEGAEVEFDVVLSPRGPWAANVRLVKHVRSVE
ncbi:MAG: cold shock domain-containing protein [Armatimonadetes bacterium]|nr:cold shock domain-containing protein [Armatimonadota bacterium]